MALLPQHRLGATDAWVSSIGFGAASLGNLFRETTDAEAADAVDTAWELGIRSFDTAPHYGLGLSERRLGAALAGRPRERFSISTKVGRRLVPNPAPTGVDDDGFVVPDDLVREWDFSRDGILASLDGSLQRLGLDHVDIVLAHDPDAAGPGAAMQALPTLIELREQGITSAIGVGTNSTQQAAELIADGRIDVVMLAGRHSLLEQEAVERVLEPAAAAGISIIAVGVYNSGLLAAPRPAPGVTYDYEPAPAELLARANRIADVCEAHGVSLPVAALAFAGAHPSVAGVALGMRTGEQVRENLQRASTPVPAALWVELIDRGLIARNGVGNNMGNRVGVAPGGAREEGAMP
jgi:D-threo-aldose 1-dehydrogenase